MYTYYLQTTQKLINKCNKLRDIPQCDHMRSNFKFAVSLILNGNKFMN